VRWRRQRSAPAPALVRSRDDPEAFIEVHDAFAGPLLRFFSTRAPDVQTAADLTAETLATVYEARGTFRGRSEEEVGAWVWRIAHNKLARFFRQRRVDRSAMERIGLPQPLVSDEELERIDDLVWLEASAGLVHDALADLPLDQQEVIRLRYVDELDDRTIATRLSVTPEVVRARASRGLRRLRADSVLRERTAEVRP
jgi:RNA polymerase sigma-70 factor (ECF subfamily)